MKYSFKEYVYFERWVSYWHQINEVLALNPETVLEVGIGNNSVSDCLKKNGVQVYSLDNNETLYPNYVGSVDEIPLIDDSHDVVLCCEVLEHLSFDKFETCLKELRRVTKKYVVLSLPHYGPPVKLSFKIPFITEKKIAYKLKLGVMPACNKEHQWEIGRYIYTPTLIRAIIEKYFTIKREFIPFECQYHHFYVLEK